MLSGLCHNPPHNPGVPIKAESVRLILNRWRNPLNLIWVMPAKGIGFFSLKATPLGAAFFISTVFYPYRRIEEGEEHAAKK